MNRYVIMLMGLPCSGKSTNALEIQKRLVVEDKIECPILSVDMNIQSMCDSNNVSYTDGWSKYIKEADALFWEQLKSALQKEPKLIIDKTHLTYKSRKRTVNFIENQSQYSYYIDLVYHYRDDTESQLLEATTMIRPGGKLIQKDVYLDMCSKLEKPTENERPFYRSIFAKELREHEILIRNCDRNCDDL